MQYLLTHVAPAPNIKIEMLTNASDSNNWSADPECASIGYGFHSIFHMTEILLNVYIIRKYSKNAAADEKILG